MKQDITEEENLQDQWYEDAKKQTVETLPEFIRHLTEDYNHDYGTICHAITAGCIATGWAINSTPGGGITGFQAGAIMWKFIREWNYKHNQLGLRLIDYDNILYPQYADKFKNTLTQDHWTKIQEAAKAKLQDNEEDKVHSNVWNHWKSIADDNLPFDFTIKNDD